MADIDDLLGSEELDYEEDFGEAKVEEDEHKDEEEDVLGIGKDEILYEHDELVLPQPHYSQKSQEKDASGETDSNNEEITQIPVEECSKDVKSNEQMSEEECIPEEIWEVQLDEQIPEDESSKEEMWEIKVDEPQHSPLPSPDHEDDQSQSSSQSQQDSEDESSADDFLAAVFENWDDQEEEKDEQNKNVEEKDEQNKLNSGKNEEDDDDDDDDDIAEDDEAEEKIRQRSRFKTERTNISFNTIVEEKKEIVDSLDSVLVPELGRGSLISFSIPKAKPLGSLAPIGSLGNIIHEKAPGQMDLLSLQLQEAKQIQFSNVQFSNVDKKAHKDTVNQTLRKIQSPVPEEITGLSQPGPTTFQFDLWPQPSTSPSTTIADEWQIKISNGNDRKDSKKLKKGNSNLVVIPTKGYLEQVKPENDSREVKSFKDRFGFNPDDCYEEEIISEEIIETKSNNKDDTDEDDEDECDEPRQRFKAERVVTSLTERTPKSTSTPVIRRDIPDSLDAVRTNPATTATISTISGYNITNEKFVVPPGKAGLIIGRGGETIKKIISESGAQVTLDRTNTVEKVFLISGRPMQVYRAKALIAKRAQIDIEIPRPESSNEPVVVVEASVVIDTANENIVTAELSVPTEERFSVPFKMAGLVIGKGGETIKKMIIQTKTTIQLDKTNTSTTEKIFNIKGLPMNVYNAKVLIAEKAKMTDVYIPNPGNQLPKLEEWKNMKTCWFFNFKFCEKAGHQCSKSHMCCICSDSQHGRMTCPYAVSYQEPATQTTTSQCSDLYVTGLSSNMTNNDLLVYFKSFGSVYHVRIKQDTITSQSTGIAQLKFFDLASQQCVLAQQHVVNGQLLTVKLASGLNSNELQQSSSQNQVVGSSSAMGFNQYYVPSPHVYPQQPPGGITYDAYAGYGYSNYYQMGMSVPHMSVPQVPYMGYTAPPPYQDVAAVVPNVAATSYQIPHANNYGATQAYNPASLAPAPAATAATTSEDARMIIENARLKKVENFLKKLDDQSKNDVPRRSYSKSLSRSRSRSPSLSRNRAGRVYRRDSRSRSRSRSLSRDKRYRHRSRSGSGSRAYRSRSRSVQQRSRSRSKSLEREYTSYQPRNTDYTHKYSSKKRSFRSPSPLRDKTLNEENYSMTKKIRSELDSSQPPARNNSSNLLESAGLDGDRLKDLLKHCNYNTGSATRSESSGTISRSHLSEGSMSDIYDVCHSLRSLCNDLALGSSSFVRSLVVKILNPGTTPSEILQLLKDPETSMQIKLAAAEFKSQEETSFGYRKSQYSQAYIQTKLLVDNIKMRGYGDYDNRNRYAPTSSNKDYFLYGLDIKELASVTENSTYEFTQKLINVNLKGMGITPSQNVLDEIMVAMFKEWKGNKEEDLGLDPVGDDLNPNTSSYVETGGSNRRQPDLVRSRGAEYNSNDLRYLLHNKRY